MIGSSLIPLNVDRKKGMHLKREIQMEPAPVEFQRVPVVQSSSTRRKCGFKRKPPPAVHSFGEFNWYGNCSEVFLHLFQCLCVSHSRGHICRGTFCSLTVLINSSLAIPHHTDHGAFGTLCVIPI